MTPNLGALSGIRVLDFTQVILGPAATQVLADFGADVIKVERPGSGDLARAFPPFLGEGEGRVSAKYLSVNRNKRSVALDLKSAEGRETILALVPHVDVVVSNFRPGVMESLGFGYEQLRPINPRVICAEGSGWGPSGPMAKKPGHELLGQAHSGLAAKNAGTDGVPATVPATVSDFTAAQLLAQGILLALLARERTGAGQRVTVSLLDGLLALQQWDEVGRLNLGPHDDGVSDHAHPLQSVYRTADRFLALVGWFRPDPLANVCRALGLPDYTQDPRFASLELLAQPVHAAAMRQIIAARVLIERPPSGLRCWRRTTSCAARRSSRGPPTSIRKRSPTRWWPASAKPHWARCGLSANRSSFQLHRQPCALLPHVWASTLTK